MVKDAEYIFAYGMYNYLSNPNKNRSHKYTPDVIRESGINEKQAYFYLSKWVDKGWLDYGVNIRAVFFINNGKAKLKEYADKGQSLINGQL